MNSEFRQQNDMFYVLPPGMKYFSDSFNPPRRQIIKVEKEEHIMPMQSRRRKPLQNLRKDDLWQRLYGGRLT